MGCDFLHHLPSLLAPWPCVQVIFSCSFLLLDLGFETFPTISFQTIVSYDLVYYWACMKNMKITQTLFSIKFSQNAKKIHFFKVLVWEGEQHFNKHECLFWTKDLEARKALYEWAQLCSFGSVVGKSPSSSLRQPCSGLGVCCACWRHPYLSAASLLPRVSAFPMRPFKITFVTLPSNHT